VLDDDQPKARGCGLAGNRSPPAMEMEMSVTTVDRSLSRIARYRRMMDPTKADVKTIARSASRIARYRMKAAADIARLDVPMVRETLIDLLNAA